MSVDLGVILPAVVAVVGGVAVSVVTWYLTRLSERGRWSRETTYPVYVDYLKAVDRCVKDALRYEVVAERRPRLFHWLSVRKGRAALLRAVGALHSADTALSVVAPFPLRFRSTMLTFVAQLLVNCASNVERSGDINGLVTEVVKSGHRIELLIRAEMGVEAFPAKDPFDDYPLYRRGRMRGLAVAGTPRRTDNPT